MCIFFISYRWKNDRQDKLQDLMFVVDDRRRLFLSRLLLNII